MMVPVADVSQSFSYLLDPSVANPAAIFISRNETVGRVNIQVEESPTLRVIATMATAPSFASDDVGVDPWTEDTLQLIAAHRGLEAGWDGKGAPPIDERCLETAEILAHAFAYLPVTDRPVFAVDAEGRPSFASFDGDRYLHLTVDQPEVISWFASYGGRDHFEDNFRVDGFNLDSLAARIATSVK